MPNENSKAAVSNLSPTVLKGELHIGIAAPADGTYVVALKTAIAVTLDHISVKTSSGTCNVALRVNGGSNVTWSGGGSTVAASSTQNSKDATANNVAGVGALVELIVSGSSSPANLSVSIHTARTA